MKVRTSLCKVCDVDKWGAKKSSTAAVGLRGEDALRNSQPPLTKQCVHASAPVRELIHNEVQEQKRKEKAQTHTLCLDLRAVISIKLSNFYFISTSSSNVALWPHQWQQMCSRDFGNSTTLPLYCEMFIKVFSSSANQNSNVAVWLWPCTNLLPLWCLWQGEPAATQPGRAESGWAGVADIADEVFGIHFICETS